MLKAAGIASVLLFVAVSGCAVEEDDLIEPACESDEKCDGESAEGFEVFKGVDGKYYFHLVSGNGKVVLRSQAYASRQGATRGVESVRVNGVDAANFKVKEASNGEWYVNLYAQNHEIIGTTETYVRKYNAQRAVDTTVRLVSEAQRIRAARSGARFQTFIGADHQAYFHLRAANGEVMLTSEGYLNPSSAIDSIASVRENGKNASQYTILQAADGQWFFHLQARNNEIIGRGETYVSRSNAQRAVDTLVGLLRSELVADPRPVARPPRSIADHDDLKTVLGALSDVAAGGTGLAYFGFAEQAGKPAGLTCEDATPESLAESYDLLIGEITTSGDIAARPDLTDELIESSKTQLAVLLGTDAYQLCSRETTGDAVTGAETFVLAIDDAGPKLVLELGFEAAP